MSRNLLTTGIVFGVCLAAASAQAATNVVKDTFDIVSIAGTTPFSLLSHGLSADVRFDKALGTLKSVEIDWSDISLTATGVTKSILFGLGGGAIADFATGAITVDGVKTGDIDTSLGLAVGVGAGKTITAKATSHGNAQTYTSGAIFNEAAAGDVQTVAWNTGTIKGLSATSLPQLLQLSHSDILYLTTRPVSSELDATLTVTYDYVAAPELSTWGMMGLGFAGLAFAGARSRRTAIGLFA